MARPLNPINWDLLDQLLGIFCTGEECAAFLNIDYETLCRAVKRVKKMGFEEYSAIKKGSGRASLRRRQFRMAETNPALAIWLGKQYLNQKDQPLIDNSKHEHFNVTVEIVDENKITPESGNRISQYVEV